MFRRGYSDDPRRALLVTLVSLVLSGVVLATVFGGSSGAATTSLSAKDREIARLKADLSRAQLDAKFWNQLVSTFTPARSLGLNSMSDHYLLRTPGGLVMALHFDNLNLAKAKNLNWIAVAVPGVFTRADQRRVNRLYGPGFTHFHDFEADVHAGKPGAKGVWFVHVGTRNFTSPFGKVRAGKVDLNFMPTKPPR